MLNQRRAAVAMERGHDPVLLGGEERYRLPPLPRAAGHRSAATRTSMNRQARTGERFLRRNGYAHWWPRDWRGRFMERCTGPRSRCEIEKNDPRHYGLARRRAS